jgi:RecB family exonuclease
MEYILEVTGDYEMSLYLTKEWQNRPAERWRAEIVLNGDFTDVVAWFPTKRAAIAWGETWDPNDFN